MLKSANIQRNNHTYNDNPANIDRDSGEICAIPLSG